MESTRKFLCIFVFIMLKACGGGGSNGNTNPNPNPQSSPSSNTAPVIKDPGVLSLREGQISSVKLTATDADNDEIIFSINAGVDKDLFTLDSNTGDLAFKSPPDYKMPKDADKDNQYELTITARDKINSASLDLRIQVVELSENQFHSISGSVLVEDNVNVDSDINDTKSILIPNNRHSDSQLLVSPPLKVVGYVSAPSEGPNGQLKHSGDLFDRFQIEALGGETITLDTLNINNTADNNKKPANLDLYLYDASHKLIAASLNRSDKSKTLIIPNKPSTYFIKVKLFYSSSDFGSRFDTKSTYRLTVDDHSDNTNIYSSGWTTDADFVIGDIIVKEQSNCNANRVEDLISKNGISPLKQKGSKSSPSLFRYGEHIIELIDNLVPNKSSLTLTRKRQDEPSEVELKTATLLAVKEIANQPCVEYAEPNFIATEMLTPNDNQYSHQWHFEKINLPDAWDTSIGSNQVKVAVLDSGVVMSHPDLTARLSDDGYDFVSYVSSTGDGDGIDNNPDDPGGGVENPKCNGSKASSFHGTHVTGILGASTDNNLGVAGVDWNALIMPIRVLGCSGTTYDIAQGVRYAAGLENNSGILVSDPADIINMSLGGKFPTEILRSAVADAVNAGVIVVAAAGNKGRSSPYYPAAYEGVISVVATDINNRKALFSNYGSTVDVAAPGVSIWNTSAKYQNGVINTGYKKMSGTSMAAPHVAGVASLMKSVYSDMSPEDFEAILMSGNITDDLGDSGRDDYFGYGLINAKKALEHAKQISDDPLLVPVTPILGLNYTYINFGLVNTEAVISASNIGSKNSNLTISGVETEHSFVTVTAPNSEDGLGDYTIRINRTDLSPGIHSSSVKFLSNAGEKTLSIVFKVLDPNQRYYGNAGNVYIHLTNTDTGEVTKINVPEPVNGKYDFNFPYVAAGKYTLKAGNDLDNNGVLCQGAEGCGHYGGNAETILEISGDTTGIDFDLRY